MKKILSLLVVFMIITVSLFAIPVSTFSEEESINVEGEWYCTGLLSNEYIVFTLDEQGTLHGNMYGTVATTIASDGILTYGDNNVYELNRLNLSDDAILYYLNSYGSYKGFLMIKSDDGFHGYNFEIRKRYLMHDGNAYDHSGSENYSYMISNGKMFIIQNDSYRGGKITRFGNYVFMITFDADPVVYEYGENQTYDAGTPIYLYISTSLLQ